MKNHKKMERLMLFHGVAESLSFAEAANAMGISKGYLSTQIKQLEQDLGTKLLHRSTRNVSLTQDGHKVFDEVQRITGIVGHIEKRLFDESIELRGNIAITAPHLFSHFFLSEQCYQFSELHPNISFSLDTSYQTHNLARVHFDLAFRSTNTPPQDMVAKRLVVYKHRFVASPQYLNRKGLPLEVADLANHHCLCGPDQQSWPIDNKAIHIQSWMKLNDNLSLLEQVLAGRGIGRLPDYVVKHHLQNNSLVELTLDPNPRKHSIYIIHAPKPQQSKRVKAFIEHVTQAIETW